MYVKPEGGFSNKLSFSLMSGIKLINADKDPRKSL